MGVIIARVISNIGINWPASTNDQCTVNHANIYVIMREGELFIKSSFSTEKQALAEINPEVKYRDEIYSLQISLSRTQSGPGRTVKLSRSKKKLLATTYKPFSRSLYI